MMSTAILMSVGAEQSAKRPVAQEPETLEGPSFAQALDARLSLEAGSKDPAAGAPPELGNAKNEPPAKNLIDVPDSTTGKKAQSFDAPSGTSAVMGGKETGDPVAGTLSELMAATKAKMSAGQTMLAGRGEKGITAGNSNPSQPVAAVSSLVHGKTEDPGTEVAEPSMNTEEIAAEEQTGLPAGSALKTQSGEVDPVENQGDQNQILTPNLDTPVGPKGTVAAGKAPETGTAKKTIKTHGSDETPTVAPKSGATEVHAMADGAKPAQGVGVQVPNPLPGQSVAYAAPVVAPTGSRNAESVGAGHAEGISASPGNSAALNPVDGSNSKNLVSTKTPASNADTTPAASGDPAATGKIDEKAERSPAVATGGDSDIKGRPAGEPPVGFVHQAASGVDLSNGTVLSGVTGLVKPPNGDLGAQTAGSPTGLREQDGSGAVARSMESMPRTLSATPTALEVGIPDGTHGWLKVRAEMSDGMVNASVSAPSAASQEMLHRELPSLTAYLQSEKVAVNTVVVHPTASTGAEPRGYPAGTESGGSGQTPQRSNEGGEQGQGSLRATGEVGPDVAGYQGLDGVGEGETLPLATYPGGGSWLSVRA